MPIELVRLGKTDILVSAVGLGAWAWGDRTIWGFGEGYGESDIRSAYDASLAAGVNWIDTAEIYGLGRSERFVGQFARDSKTRPLIATKLFPVPWRFSRQAVVAALQESLKRLGMDHVDLYQIHWPMPILSTGIWLDGLADAVQQGLTRTVGVSNYNAAQTRAAHAALARRGVTLASNQVEYSLLNRGPETSGLVDVCRELGVSIIAYSPIGKGILTGKYSSLNPPPGRRRVMYRSEYLDRVQPLIGLLRELGQTHGDRTPAQVSLNWLICKGAIPIPGAKNARQAQENAGAMNWRLDDSQISALDQLCARLA